MAVPRDRVHVDPEGLVLTDSDLALLSRVSGQVVMWPALRSTPPPQAKHMARIRTSVFGGAPGGEMIPAMQEYDRKLRAAGEPEAFGAYFIAMCQLSVTKDKRRDSRPPEKAQADADVLRLWLGG
ncbi:hypothetical protein [Austwickia chelonae]|uniref:hypothetical protein n=1 Tax=Austwickia chelonae TaxID=100225 RepID=UPI000E250DF1|nr:hypothetical protein [Austwickia chelonae]